jgi:RimJ/RimL family protein N-acetyltransferase
MTIIIQTERLNLRIASTEDATFYCRLVNEASFINNIRDKGIRTIEQASACLQTEHINVQEKRGFSLYIVERKADQLPLGVCGFVKREELDDVDVGYALLPEFTGQGYAKEALLSLLPYASKVLQLKQLAAITSTHNTASIQLLQKVGFEFQKVIPWKEKEQVNFYLIKLA